MNVKKQNFKKLDKENSFQDLNTSYLNISNTINKKHTRLGEQVRRKMRLNNQSKLLHLNALNPMEIKSRSGNICLNSDILNRTSKNVRKPLVEAQFKSINADTICDGASTSRSVKSVRFQDKTDELKLRRKHSTSSILKQKSYMQKSLISDRSGYSLKSSVCSNVLGSSQSSENTGANKIIKQKYQKLLQNVKISNKKYSDQLFPPLKSCLYSSRTLSTGNYAKISWVRISELFPGKSVTVWSKDQSDIQIKNGQATSSKTLPNCFNCIKYNTFLLQKIFENQKYNMHGIYLIKINQNNQWKYVIIDDYIPVCSAGNKILEGAFLKVVDHKKYQEINIWPYLLQKAYAKYYSTYQALYAGETTELNFLQQLTGCPIEEIQVNQNNIAKIRQELRNYDTILIGRQRSNPDCFPLRFYPIVPRKQDFNYYDPYRNSQIIKNRTDSGFSKTCCTQKEFIVKFQTVCFIFLHKYFYSGFCTIKQHYSHSNSSIKNSSINNNKSQSRQDISIRHFKLDEARQCVVSVSQKDKKHYINNCYSYCWIRGQKSYRWIAGRYGQEKTLAIKSWLEAGQYQVILIPQWKSKSFDLNLIFHGNSMCQIERKPSITNENILIEGAMDLAQRNGRMKQLNQNICTYTYIDKQMGFIIENINNQRVNGDIRIMRSVQGLQNSTSTSIRAFNKEFKKKHTIQVRIQSLQHFTVLLGVCGGVNKAFLEQFDFGS